LKAIYKFLEKDLSSLENELKNRLLLATKNKIDLYNVIQYFFEIPGKRLRPILVLLSSGIVRSMKFKTFSNEKSIDENIIKLSAALELIHSSSLIHDDIVDGSSHRRGQITMNYKFNNKIAVLAGDMLYSHAFLIINRLKISGISEILSQCVEKMCQCEINEIISPYANFEQYISYLDSKTASLMSTCCKLGAIISGADDETVLALSNFGSNFGILYQLMDDYCDDDEPKNFKVNIQSQANAYAESARNDLEKFNDSENKKQLLYLIRFVTEKFKHKNDLIAEK